MYTTFGDSENGRDSEKERKDTKLKEYKNMILMAL
jgi:hypothetical protein